MSQDVVTDIKDRLPLLEYLEHTGLKLRRQGHTFVAVCPFHSEKTGSFTVYPDNHWHCFGCGKSGDLFAYYMMKYNCDFLESLRSLAREAGVQLREVAEVKAAIEKSRERSEILATAVRFFHSQLGDEQRDYLRKRGFTDDFMDAYQFGYTEGDCVRKAFLDLSVAKLQEVGLLTTPDRPEQGVRDFFWQRIMIPIYQNFGKDNTIVNLVGRAFPDDGNALRKYLRLPGCEQLINEGALRGAKEVYLCEGDTDTPTLIQAGLPTVGVPGASALKDEFIERFAKAETIYVCADPDNAGEGLTRRAGEMFGPRCRVVTLPEGFDVNAYVAQSKGDIVALAAQAKLYIDWLLERMPAELPPDQADKVLLPVLSALGKFNKASQDLYARKVAGRFGLTLAVVREAIRERQTAVNGHSKETRLADSKIIWTLPTLINPAQDFVDNVAVTTIFLDVTVEDEKAKKTKVMALPHLITSSRQIYRLDDGEIKGMAWRYPQTKVPLLGVVKRRWSSDEAQSFSAKSYLDHKISINPWEVYKEVVGYFKSYLDYPNELYFDLIALWTIGTYFFNCYQGYPYLHLTGAKRVGKSRTLSIIHQLAFNALWSASMTPAAAYRSIEACSSTLLLDEAEHLKTRKDKDSDDGDYLEILKAGYQKGQQAIRCSGDNHEPTGFDLYSPKAFGGTQGLDAILGDRTIPLVLARRKRKLPEFLVSHLAPSFQSTRDRLYILMLDYMGNVMEEIKAGIGWDGVQDRERELWTPILTLAQFIDGARMEDEPNIPSAELLTGKMRTLATQKVAEKQAREQAEQFEVIVLEATLEFLKNAQPIQHKEPHFYAITALFEFLQAYEGLGWLKDARGAMAQLEKVTAVDAKKDRDRTKVGSKTVRIVRLDIAKIRELAIRYGAVVE